MGFQVGQRVVCVDADPRGFSEQSLDGLRERGIYHVRWCGIYALHHAPGVSVLMVRLTEIIRAPCFCPQPNGVDMPYLSSRFRPLTERKTDISVFRRLLKPQREDA